MPAAESTPARLVVLVSGAGTNLQALIDACADPAYGARIVAVGADRDGIEGLARAERAGIPTFVRQVGEFATRRLLGPRADRRRGRLRPGPRRARRVHEAGRPGRSCERFAGRVVNTHPALCPAFPGTNGPGDALAYGVKVTGATLFVVDDGVDTGPIVAQTAVPVEDDDDVESLHERIKVRRAADARRQRRPDRPGGPGRRGSAGPVRSAAPISN